MDAAGSVTEENVSNDGRLHMQKKSKLFFLQPLLIHLHPLCIHGSVWRHKPSVKSHITELQ